VILRPDPRSNILFGYTRPKVNIEFQTSHNSAEPSEIGFAGSMKVLPHLTVGGRYFAMAGFGILSVMSLLLSEQQMRNVPGLSAIQSVLVGAEYQSLPQAALTHYMVKVKGNKDDRLFVAYAPVMAATSLAYARHLSKNLTVYGCIDVGLPKRQFLGGSASVRFRRDNTQFHTLVNFPDWKVQSAATVNVLPGVALSVTTDVNLLSYEYNSGIGLSFG